MKIAMRIVGVALLFGPCLSGCVEDAQITVTGSADKASECLFKRYTDSALVEFFQISGKFKETYAVSSASEKRVEITCKGSLVAERTLSAIKGDVDFGRLPP